MTTIIINDFVTDRRMEILFNHPQDFEQIDQYWEKEDKLLLEMQGNEFFKGHTRWCELNPTHFRFLLMATLNKVAVLTDEQQADSADQTMASLTFVITGFIKCMEDRTESTLELMRINRLDENEVLYDYTGSVNMHLETSRRKKGLRVIVDNT